MIDNGEFLEYALVYDNIMEHQKYVIDKINEGKDVILEIDIQGQNK